MWLFDCAEPRKSKKPASSFKVHRPPSSEWVYGAWVGKSDRHERERRELAGQKRAEHERYGTMPGSSRKPESNRNPGASRKPERSHKLEPSQKPGSSRNPVSRHEQSGQADRMRADTRRQPRREPQRESDTSWPTLAEVEANERYGPRGRNERYDRKGVESVDERFEPAYAKLIAQSDRKGRSHRQQEKKIRGPWEEHDPWTVDVGIVVPKASKFSRKVY